MWLAMPGYGDTFAGLRDPTQFIAATKQASASRLLWHWAWHCWMTPPFNQPPQVNICPCRQQLD